MRIPRSLCALALLAILAACAHAEDYTPTIDMSVDPRADRVQADLTTCKYLATRAGEKGWKVTSRSTMTTEDGITVNGTMYRHAYINCMRARGHKVID